MIDGSEKRNRQLAFKLQNSHVCEKRSNLQLDFWVLVETLLSCLLFVFSMFYPVLIICFLVMTLLTAIFA